MELEGKNTKTKNEDSDAKHQGEGQKGTGEH